MKFEPMEVEVKGREMDVVKEIKKIFEEDAETSTKQKDYLFIADNGDEGLFAAVNGNIVNCMVLVTVLTKTLADNKNITHKSFLKGLQVIEKEVRKLSEREESPSVERVTEYIEEIFEDKVMPKFERRNSIADIFKELMAGIEEDEDIDESND